MLFMPHLPTSGAGVEDAPGREGYSKSLNIWTIYIKFNFHLRCIGKSIKGLLLRSGCIFNSRWYHIHHGSICTTGHVLQINNIYTYKEDRVVDIVRLTDVLIERDYLYCSLFFFSKNKIITVRQILQKDASIIWRLTENEEFDEAMSMKLWQEVNR